MQRSWIHRGVLARARRRWKTVANNRNCLHLRGTTQPKGEGGGKGWRSGLKGEHMGEYVEWGVRSKYTQKPKPIFQTYQLIYLRVSEDKLQLRIYSEFIFF